VEKDKEEKEKKGKKEMIRKGSGLKGREKG